jgi:predicted acetyltransferase
MEIEIRPVAADEVDAYIRAVPGAAGLPTWEPEPAAWWAGPGHSSPFGGRISDKEVARYRSEVRELDRTQAAFADGKLVGTSGLYTLEITVPGARQVAMGGVTSVGVLPTHRCRGLLRGMMRAMHYGPDGTIDGAAIYRFDLTGSGTVQVDWFEASSADAYAALWMLLADLDLTKRLVAAKRPVDEPLRWQLADPRALRVTRTADDLWIRLVDVGGALAARTYQVPGSLVLEVTDSFCRWNTGRWQLDGGPDGASCSRAAADATAELALDAATLGSLYLGGTSPGPLARAGLIHELVPGALNRATAMLAQPDAPFNPLGF